VLNPIDLHELTIGKTYYVRVFHKYGVPNSGNFAIAVNPVYKIEKINLGGMSGEIYSW
jgi:hypothetical protein